MTIGVRVEEIIVLSVYAIILKLLSPSISSTDKKNDLTAETSLTKDFPLFSESSRILVIGELLGICTAICAVAVVTLFSTIQTIGGWHCAGVVVKNKNVVRNENSIRPMFIWDFIGLIIRISQVFKFIFSGSSMKTKFRLKNFAKRKLVLISLWLIQTKICVPPNALIELTDWLQD